MNAHSKYSISGIKNTLEEEFQHEMSSLMQENGFDATIIKEEEDDDGLIIEDDGISETDKTPSTAPTLMEGITVSPFVTAVKIEKDLDCEFPVQGQLNINKNVTEDKNIKDIVLGMQQTLNMLMKEVFALKAITSTTNTYVEQKGHEFKSAVKHILTKMENQEQTLKEIRIKCSENDPIPSIKYFPFSSIEQLQEAEEDLDHHCRSDIINYMKSMVGHHPLTRCFSIMFTEDFLLQINWDGSRNKHALNRFRIFNTFLYEAIHRDSMSYDRYERDMKVGFKMAKNKLYKSNYRQKQCIQTPLEDQQQQQQEQEQQQQPPPQQQPKQAQILNANGMVELQIGKTFFISPNV